MPTLRFMPWCHLDKPYHVGDMALIPFDRDSACLELPPSTVAAVRLILRSYRAMSGYPVKHAVVLQLGSRDVLDEALTGEQDDAQESIQLATFGGLAYRDYFDSLGNYCNADCFETYFQTFKTEPTFGCLITRCFCGSSSNSIPLAELACSMPRHIPNGEVKLDQSLIDALASFQRNVDSDRWARFLNAITCFNRANTDASNSMPQIEWVLLSSAYEHILRARPNNDRVAERFTSQMCCPKTIMAQDSSRKLANWRDKSRPLIHEWMKEFYRVRGDFAHGRLATQQPMAWSPNEHIGIAAIGFPLLVRSLLQAEGRYIFSERDRCQLAAFENIVEEHFLENEIRPGAMDRPRAFWLLSQEKQKLEHEKMVARMQERLE